MKRSVLLITMTVFFVSCGSDGGAEKGGSGGMLSTAAPRSSGASEDISIGTTAGGASIGTTGGESAEPSEGESIGTTGGESAEPSEGESIGTTGGESAEPSEGESVGTTEGSSGMETAQSTAQSSTVSFARDIQEAIFTPSCATVGCHAGENPSGALNLEAGEAWGEIVNQPSTEQTRTGTTLDRIEPERPARSYLFLKVTADPKISGAPMPLGGSPLSQEAIDTLERWILEGALDN